MIFASQQEPWKIEDDDGMELAYHDKDLVFGRRQDAELAAEALSDAGYVKLSELMVLPVRRVQQLIVRNLQW